ncbi:DNA-deoxyinosine glycosylase [Chitinimonas sp.]|uniref:DNA-deoxyinosine glycosylase n=1 Tax=Chitinimonas sp. TaxID=1934313 RepID=UPI002F940722
MSERKRSFPPVVDSQTRLLILGSLPGDASLAKAQYYGHPQNKFWELVGAVIHVDLRALPYEARLASLLAHGIGLWDVIAEAERKGSLDASIRDEQPNSIMELVYSLPALKAVAFNGGTAARIGRQQLKQLDGSIILFDLPSSSPAHAVRFEQKAQKWAAIGQSLTGAIGNSDDF